MTSELKQQKKANGRYEGTNYRYSTKFINTLTGWLIAWIFIGTGIGFGLGALGDVFFAETDVPTWYSIMAITVTLSGVGLPLLVGAWFGAMAINKYAGPVGLVFALGIGALAAGQVFHLNMWTWIGVGAIVLTTVLFFYIGFQARVPIWLQLPFLNSPRLYITKGESINNKMSSKKK